MKKIKYYYNTSSLRYEKLETPLRVRLLRIFGFIAAALVTAAIIAFIAFRFIGSPEEKETQRKYSLLIDDMKDLQQSVKSLENQLTEIEKRDNNI